MSLDVSNLLRHYPPWCRPLSAPEPLGNAGGASGARLWRFASARGTLVARAWPSGSIDDRRLATIHGWLAEARHLGFVPVPIADIHGRTFQGLDGRLWQVEPWMSGSAVRGRPMPPQLRAGMIALASFHQALARHRRDGPSPSPGLAARLREIDGLLTGGFEALDRSILSSPADPLRDPARRWLDLARRLAPSLRESIRPDAGLAVPLQPCVRDLRPDHLLFEGDRLTGLVDFGAMDIESVAADLARLLPDWPGDDRADALSAYASIRPLDEGEPRLTVAFERTADLLLGGHWARWHFIERRVFDDPEAVGRGLRRGLDRLAALAVVR